MAEDAIFAEFAKSLPVREAGLVLVVAAISGLRGAIRGNLLEAIAYDLVSSWHPVCVFAIGAFLAIAKDVQELAGDDGIVLRGISALRGPTFASGGGTTRGTF